MRGAAWFMNLAAWGLLILGVVMGARERVDPGIVGTFALMTLGFSSPMAVWGLLAIHTESTTVGTKAPPGAPAYTDYYTEITGKAAKNMGWKRLALALSPTTLAIILLSILRVVGPVWPG